MVKFRKIPRFGWFYQSQVGQKYFARLIHRLFYDLIYFDNS